MPDSIRIDLTELARPGGTEDNPDHVYRAAARCPCWTCAVREGCQVECGPYRTYVGAVGRGEGLAERKGGRHKG